MAGTTEEGLAKAGDNSGFQYFTNAEAETFQSWCDIIVNGSARAKVAQFVDQSLAAPFATSLILLRYLDSGELGEFYRAGIAGIETESNHRFSLGFTQLTKDEKNTIVADAVASKLKAWKTPDPNFFYFISRSDAVDVVFGTEAGFEQLGISYMAHIPPPKPW